MIIFSYLIVRMHTLRIVYSPITADWNKIYKKKLITIMHAGVASSV